MSDTSPLRQHLHQAQRTSKIRGTRNPRTRRRLTAHGICFPKRKQGKELASINGALEIARPVYLLQLVQCRLPEQHMVNTADLSNGDLDQQPRLLETRPSNVARIG